MNTKDNISGNADKLTKLERAYAARQISDKDYEMWKRVYRNEIPEETYSSHAKRGRKRRM